MMHTMLCLKLTAIHLLDHIFFKLYGRMNIFAKDVHLDHTPVCDGIGFQTVLGESVKYV